MKIEEYIELNYPTKKQTYYNVRSQLKEFFNFIKILPEQYIKQERDFKKDVLKYHSHLINKKRTIKKNSHVIEKTYAAKTIVVHMSTLRGYLEFHDIIFSPRWWKAQTKKGKGTDTILEDRIPTREELQKILTHGDARDHAFFLTMLSSGMREEELCKVSMDNVDFESNPVMIKIPADISKTKKKRFTFVSIEAKNALEEWKKLRDTYIVNKEKKCKGLYKYLERKYNKIPNGAANNRLFPYRPLAAQTWWNRLLNKAGFTEFDKNTGYYVLHLYTLRKFFDTVMKTNCNQLMVDMWMGHEVKYDYEKWTEDQHKNEYLKGMDSLLVYRTPANIEKLEELQQRADKVYELEQRLNELNNAMFEMLNKDKKD